MMKYYKSLLIYSSLLTKRDILEILLNYENVKQRLSKIKYV